MPNYFDEPDDLVEIARRIMTEGFPPKKDEKKDDDKGKDKKPEASASEKEEMDPKSKENKQFDKDDKGKEPKEKEPEDKDEADTTGKGGEEKPAEKGEKSDEKPGKDDKDPDKDGDDDTDPKKDTDGDFAGKDKDEDGDEKTDDPTKGKDKEGEDDQVGPDTVTGGTKSKIDTKPELNGDSEEQIVADHVEWGKGTVIPGQIYEYEDRFYADVMFEHGIEKWVDITEEYLGFKKLKSKLSHEKGVDNPGALAASIGRKKYGAKKFAAMSHHKEEVEQIDEKFKSDEELKSKRKHHGRETLYHSREADRAERAADDHRTGDYRKDSADEDYHERRASRHAHKADRHDLAFDITDRMLKKRGIKEEAGHFRSLGDWKAAARKAGHAIISTSHPDSDDADSYFKARSQSGKIVGSFDHVAGHGHLQEDVSNADVDSGDKHILVQLRKAKSVGSHKVTFANGESHNIDRKTASDALDKHDSYQKPGDREYFQKRLGHSHGSFRTAVYH